MIRYVNNIYIIIVRCTIRKLYTIAHSKRRTQRVGVFDCALATVTLQLINPPLLYSAIQQSWIAIYIPAG
jgi:hypothetical protein